MSTAITKYDTISLQEQQLIWKPFVPINTHELGKPWKNKWRTWSGKKKLKKDSEHIRRGQGNEMNRIKIKDYETMSRHNESKTKIK